MECYLAHLAVESVLQINSHHYSFLILLLIVSVSFDSPLSATLLKHSFILNMLVDRSSQPASSVKAGKAGKGQRKTKFVPPAVTSIVWSSVEDSYLAQIAADKLGGRSKLPTNDHAVGKAAFNAYSAKDLAFILQGVGFSQSPFPTKKAALIKAILAIRYDNNHLSQDNSSEHHAGLSPAVEGKASSASLVSVSPRRRSSIGIVPVVGSKIRCVRLCSLCSLCCHVTVTFLTFKIVGSPSF